MSSWRASSSWRIAYEPWINRTSGTSGNPQCTAITQDGASVDTSASSAATPASTGGTIIDGTYVLALLGHPHAVGSISQVFTKK